MRKAVLLLLILFVFSTEAFGARKAKFCPILNLVVSRQADETSFLADHFSIFPHPVTGQTNVGALIRFKETSASSFLANVRKVGGEVNTLLPSGIATAWLPLRSLPEIGQMDEVVYIELAVKLKPLLDVSRMEMGIDRVHSGLNLPAAIQGEGVIIGIIDTGIDQHHTDFLQPDGATRLVSIWDQCAGNGTPPQGYNYGDESDAMEINQGLCTQEDKYAPSHGHGTHVTGISAGSGRAPNGHGNYTGLAPRSEIIVVNSLGGCPGSGSTVLVVDAANYILQKAKVLGKPAVINMSLGTQAGSHDGTSLFEQALTQLTGPGKIMVAAAGNEGSSFIHLGYEVNSDGANSLFFPYYGANQAIFDMWYSSQYQINVLLGRVDANSGKLVEYIGWVAPGQSREGRFSTGQEAYIDAAETANPQNGDSHVQMVIAGHGFDQYLWAVGFSAHQKGQTAYFDCWSIARTGQFATNMPDFRPGDNRQTVGMPATAEKIIAVAAYNTKNQWTDMNGQLRSNPSVITGDRAIFSSLGPARDGRLKPEMAAPGQIIVSALSDDIPIGGHGIPQQNVVLGGYYQTMEGTSMACPHITAAIALMLQQRPTLDYQEALKILSQTARMDQYTGQLPNTSWGYGKVDGYAAVASIVNNSGTLTLDDDAQKDE